MHEAESVAAPFVYDHMHVDSAPLERSEQKGILSEQFSGLADFNMTLLKLWILLFENGNLLSRYFDWLFYLAFFNSQPPIIATAETFSLKDFLDSHKADLNAVCFQQGPKIIPASTRMRHGHALDFVYRFMRVVFG
ncbi:hypothetical protein HGB13_05095 [bacterium]|nr:hypothetical protein [bacterium]